MAVGGWVDGCMNTGDRGVKRVHKSGELRFRMMRRDCKREESLGLGWRGRHLYTAEPAQAKRGEEMLDV